MLSGGALHDGRGSPCDGWQCPICKRGRYEVCTHHATLAKHRHRPTACARLSDTGAPPCLLRKPTRHPALPNSFISAFSPSLGSVSKELCNRIQAVVVCRACKPSLIVVVCFFVSRRATFLGASVATSKATTWSRCSIARTSPYSLYSLVAIARALHPLLCRKVQRQHKWKKLACRWKYWYPCH